MTTFTFIANSAVTADPNWRFVAIQFLVAVERGAQIGIDQGADPGDLRDAKAGNVRLRQTVGRVHRDGLFSPIASAPEPLPRRRQHLSKGLLSIERMKLLQAAALRVT
jgi:hypothetical protein